MMCLRLSRVIFSDFVVLVSDTNLLYCILLCFCVVSGAKIVKIFFILECGVLEKSVFLRSNSSFWVLEVF